MWACTFSTSQRQRRLKTHSFWHFWLPNVLRATTAGTFWASHLPKVVRTWCAFYILTSKCASRHSDVHFFDITTCKSGPMVRNWSVFDTADLEKVLRAMTACTFSSLIWPAGSAPAALASLLFDPPKPLISGKTQWIATFHDFPTFSCTCIFFLLTLSFPWSSYFFSSPLWLYPPLLFHLSILSEVWLLNFLRFVKLVKLVELVKLVTGSDRQQLHSFVRSWSYLNRNLP